MTTTQRPTITEIVEANISAGFDQLDEPDPKYECFLLGSILEHAYHAQDNARECGYTYDQCQEAFYRVAGSLVGRRVDGFEFLKLAQYNAAYDIAADGRVVSVAYRDRPSVYFVVSESGYIVAATTTKMRAEVMAIDPIRLTVKITIPKRANQWGEFHCKAYDQDGKRNPDADYYTDDRQDAEDTRKLILGRFQR